MEPSQVSCVKHLFRIYAVTLTDATYVSKKTYRVLAQTAERAIALAKVAWRSGVNFTATPAPDAVWVDTLDVVDVVDIEAVNASVSKDSKSD